MIIKNLVMKGFKGFFDEYSIDFDSDQSIIEGDNFQGKTSIGEAICWCLLGCNLFGNDKTANLINSNSDTAYCRLTFLDNENVEHTIYRSKGKENNLILDNHKADTEILSKFYYTKKIFLSVYNPYYFSTLEPKDQRDLLREILPPINYLEAFELLDESEKNILVEPRIDLNGFMKNARADIKELEKEEENFLGRKQYASSIVNSPLEQEKKFTNESYLLSLEKEYYSVLSDNKTESKKDLQKKIMDTTNTILEKEKDLTVLDEQISKLKKAVEDIDNNKGKCLYCNSKIESKKAEEIKQTALIQITEYSLKKENIEHLLKDLRSQKYMLLIKNNMASDDKDRKLELLNQKIKDLRMEKDEIQRYNMQLLAKNEAQEKAKSDLEILEKAIQENHRTKEILKTQIEVAKSLNMRIIENQMEMVKEYLNKVKLIFYKVDSDTGEIKDDYKILYENKEYNVLSLSEKIRASLEISNLINKRVGCKIPTFIDNSESITHYNSQFDNQVIFAKVVPEQKLRLVS